MTPKEMRTKDTTELQKELSELLRAHFSLRMQKATQQLTNTTQLGRVRREVARVRTILAEKSRAQ